MGVGVGFGECDVDGVGVGVGVGECDVDGVGVGDEKPVVIENVGDGELDVDGATVVVGAADVFGGCEDPFAYTSCLVGSGSSGLPAR